jgi:DNA-binding FadR family transcriptional regulator
LAQSTLAYLRRKISSGEWPVNYPIPKEQELMELLGVGKSTVREAVRSLANLGILEALPGRGTFVRSKVPVSSVLREYISDYDIADVLGLRRALEIEAAQQAAVNRTDAQAAALRAACAMHPNGQRDLDYPPRTEHGRTPGQFHFLVFEASGSGLLTGLYAGVMAVLRQALDQGELGYGASADERQRDHAAILDAIAAGDVPGTAHAMAIHVDRDLVSRLGSS